MVAHFRSLAAHRRSVLELYRCLLRHCAHLPGGSPVGDELISKVKRHFELGKGLMSPRLVRERLTEGYELESRLRNGINKGELDLVEVRAMLSVPEKGGRRRLKNRFGQPIKRDLENEQDLERQQIQNYLNRYIQLKQHRGELPKRIDPLVVEPLLKPEALFHRAMMDIEIAQRKVSRGPYQVHVSTSSGMRFLRGPWVQHPRISSKILLQTKLEQQLLDVTRYYEQWRWLYDSENHWELQMGTGAGDWGETIETGIRTLARRVESIKLASRKYAENKLPEMLVRQQRASDGIHRRMKKRLAQLLDEAQYVTPHEDLLNRPTLRQLVAKHKFLSR